MHTIQNRWVFRNITVYQTLIFYTEDHQYLNCLSENFLLSPSFLLVLYFFLISFPKSHTIICHCLQCSNICFLLYLCLTLFILSTTLYSPSSLYFLSFLILRCRKLRFFFLCNAILLIFSTLKKSLKVLNSKKVGSRCLGPDVSFCTIIPTQ